MPIDIGHISVGTVTTRIGDLLGSTSPDRQIVNTQLNSALKSELLSSASRAQNKTLTSLVQSLPAADIGVDQNLTLREFVAKHAMLPTDPTAKAAADAAIATLSSATTVATLLGLSQKVSDNPAL